MKTDEQIERQADIKHIKFAATKLGLSDDDVEFFGKFKAKIAPNLASSSSNLILVTATNPTPFGEGKTTVTVGLSDGLAVIGKNVCAVLREPSLGPIFGMKGGATGGGMSQVTPSEDINLHFNGDFHAITSANNLIASMIDNSLQFGNELNIDPQKIIFKRCLDMNDRSLRKIEIGLEKSNKISRSDGFVITAASEIMAILCLATNLENLKQRVSEIIVAFNTANQPVRVKDLGCVEAVCVLLKEAIKPNLVQTLEGTPVLIHGGPFANIAHGCNSIIATKTALNLSDFVVTEAGFGAELGAQKFLDIKCQVANIAPKCVVIVSTIRSLKYNGGCDKDSISKLNFEALKIGSENLKAHIQNLCNFNQNVVVALNKFATDSDDEISFVKDLCSELGVEFSLCEGFLKGSEGTKDLAKKVVRICEKSLPKIRHTYETNDDVKTKIEKIATKIYGAKDVIFSDQALSDLAEISRLGYERLPVCIAKTQYSFSSDAKLLGRARDFSFEISSLQIRAGAGFIVAISGTMMLMPGLPKIPAAVGMKCEI